MSEIVNYSVKIDNEQRDLLQKKIAESEMTAGNFLSAMLLSYEAAQSRESLSDIRELNQVRNHLARIEEIYIGLAKSRKDAEENHVHDTTDLKKQLESTKAKLVDVQTTTKTEVESITRKMKELTEKVDQENKKNALELTAIIKQKEIAEESQRQAVKITILTEQTLEQTKNHMAELIANATSNKQKAEQSINELAQKNLELSTAVQHQAAFKEQLEKERDNFKRTLEEHQHRSELNKEKVILLTQQAALTKRESLQDEIAKLREQLIAERERTLQTLLANSHPTPTQQEIMLINEKNIK